MKRLLLFDFFRGPDSTGFASISKQGEPSVVKIASHPLDLFEMKKFNDALNAYKSTVFLGHNRLATKGKVNGYNAHPYTFDHIVGAHNGTLEKSSWDAIEEKLGEKYEVDSMAIFACIAKFGIENTVPLLQGAWALVWYDLSEGTLNFLRNKERSFWYAYSETFDKVFWGSEHEFIHAACGLSTTTYKLYTEEPKGYKYFATEIDWWYRFDIEDFLKVDGKTKPKPKVKELKGKEAAVTTTTTFFPKAGQTGSTSSTRTTTTSPTRPPFVTGGDGDSNVIPFRFWGNNQKPFGDFVTEQEFNSIAQYGCSWCSASVDYDEPGVQVFKARDMVLCPDCSLGDKDTGSRLILGPDDLEDLVA